MRVPQSWVEPLKTALITQTNPFHSSNNLEPQLSAILDNYKKQLLTMRGLLPNLANKRYVALVNNLILEIEHILSR